LLHRIRTILEQGRQRRATGQEGTLARGHQAETLAARHLSRKGLRLLERNVRAGRGEIDLILLDGETLVFAEVRARKDGARVQAAESITAAKRRKLTETAERLLAVRPEWRQRPCRFDVIAVSLPPAHTADREPAIDWIRDAFQ